ncbi:protein Aster-C [Protopterus annectens]|uniref:protein Aster-C n=1 Tax=Protopterus annectens TaxID=7888 RepID=UPI001CFBE114|nr:protein Aster-C [Protopterus annectens]XP_043929086.1 protein Aster-C [Protopterus annectens]
MEERETLQLPESSHLGGSSRNINDNFSGHLERPSPNKIIRVDSPVQDTVPDGVLSSVFNNNLPVRSTSPVQREESPNEGQIHRSSAVISEKDGHQRNIRSFPTNLDLNGNEDLPADQSYTQHVPSERKNVPIQIDLPGRLYINRIFHISAETMFELLFKKESPFIQTFMDSRKIKDVVIGSWKKDETSGNNLRFLNYVITISNPVIGKFTSATEKQMWYQNRHDSGLFMVDAEVTMNEVPYHDYFYNVNRYCIIHTSKHKCRLRVSSDISYRKQPWGLIKSFIEKNSYNGLEDYFKQLESDLVAEEKLLNDHSPESRLRRRRQNWNENLTDHGQRSCLKRSTNNLNQKEADGTAGRSSRKHPYKGTSFTVMLALSFFLILLVLLNITLFIKLLKIEHVAQKLHVLNKFQSADTNIFAEGEHHMDRSQLRDLKELLLDSIGLLEQLRSSLILLQKRFELGHCSGQTPDC